MLVLKKDLPFGKAGTKVFRKVSGSIVSDKVMYHYYITDAANNSWCIGSDTICDMSEWVEEVNPNKIIFSVELTDKIIKKLVSKIEKDVRKRLENYNNRG